MTHTLHRLPSARIALLLVASASACASLSAQNITVRLLNANNGKPLGERKITVQWGEDRGAATVAIGKDGLGHVAVPPGASDFILVSGPHTGNDPHRIAYRDCNADALAQISVATVVAQGVAPRNHCSGKTAKATPGEVIFWGEPPASWFADNL